MPKKKRGQNEGSVYKGKDGRWRAIVPARYSDNGKRRMIVGSARAGTNTREAVAQELGKALGGQPGEILPPSRETVETFLGRWLRTVKPRIRPRTLEAYTYTANKLIIPHIGGVKLQALDARHVEAMMTRLTEEGRAPRSVAYARTVLRIALKDAKRKKIVRANVADREHVDPPRVPKTEVDVYTADEVVKILDNVEDPDSRMLLATIATFGLRIGEALGLRWRDVDLKERKLRIVRAVQRQPGNGLAFVEVKTARSQRPLLLPEALAEELKEHRRRQREHRMRLADLWQEHDLVFPTRLGGPREPRNALRSLHRAEEKAGLPKKGLHKLRSSAATILLSSGVDLDIVSDMLGHASIHLTKSTYAAYVMKRQEGASAVMGALLSRVKAE